MKFSPCPEFGIHQGCYQCAIEIVLREIGWSDQCLCFRAGTQLCGKNCADVRDEWATAITMASTGDEELARQRLFIRGRVLKRVLLLKDDDIDEDITDAVTAGEPTFDGNQPTFVEQKVDLEQAALTLCREVESDPISFDAAALLVSEAIRDGNMVPIPLRDWAADVLQGIAKRPEQAGRHKAATTWRDRLIIRLIQELVEITGLYATSGERERGQSACNAVADGLKILRFQPDSYESIVKIWGRRKHILAIGHDVLE